MNLQGVSLVAVYVCIGVLHILLAATLAVMAEERDYRKAHKEKLREALRAQVDEDAHLRSVVELYRSDPMAMADALWRMREELGRLRSVVEESHDVPPEERERA